MENSKKWEINDFIKMQLISELYEDIIHFECINGILLVGILRNQN